MNPSAALEALSRELDAPGWRVVYDAVDVQFSRRPGVSGAPVDCLRTSSEHAVPAERMARFLGDVIDAMSQIVGTYAGGRRFEPIDGVEVIATCAALPWPLADRAFPHGVASDREGDIWRVAYVPLEPAETPTLPGFLTVPMYPSGQRITALGPARCRVEHLINCALGGRISPQIQDRWMGGATMRAYVDEWRRLRWVTLPEAAEVDVDALLDTGRGLIETARGWPTIVDRPGERLARGRATICARDALHTVVDVQAPVEEVVDLLGERYLDGLAAYSAEYHSGEAVEVLEASPQRLVSRHTTRFRTPWPLADRHYDCLFARAWADDGSAWLMQRSVAADAPPPGTVRALLHPTVHHITARPDGGTRIEHVMLTDLGGKLGPLQDRWLGGAIERAAARDIAALRRLFGAPTAAAITPDSHHA